MDRYDTLLFLARVLVYIHDQRVTTSSCACTCIINVSLHVMYVAYVHNLTAGDEYKIATVSDGMWMGGSASPSNGFNDPFWTGYLIG